MMMGNELDMSLSTLAADLAAPACNGYLQRPLPCELDSRIEDMLNVFRTGSADVRAKVRSSMTTDQAFGLLAYAERMATLSVRNCSLSALENALLAIVLEGFRLDARETILILALIDHSAQRLGADSAALFEQAASQASNEAAGYLREFASRKPDTRSIEAMGYSEGMGPEGFIYIRQW